MTTRRVAVVSRSAGLAFLGVLTACGGGGDTTGPPSLEPVASVSVTLASSTLLVGATTQATATPLDAGGNALAGRSVSWSSSNTSVASVSAQGVVTAVGAGSAQVVATSEGKTGQAAITVTAPVIGDPQVSNVTITQNGQAVDLNQVAGTIALDFTLDLPPGYSGTLTVSVDTVVFLRETVSAPAAGAGFGDGVAAGIVTTHRADLETARTSLNVSSVRVEEIPSLRNGDLAAIVNVVPTVQGAGSFQQSIPFRAANPIHAHGAFVIDGVPVIDQSNRTWTGGMGRGAVVFANYGTEVITGFEVVLAPKSAVYGSSAIAGVIQTITRTNGDIFTFDTPPVEQSDVTFVLNFVTIGGQTINPRVTPLGGPVTTSLNGSGWVNTPQQVLGLNVPAGVRYVQAHQLPVDLLGGAGTHYIADADPIHIDNLAPRTTGPGTVFSFFDRNLTFGQPAYDPTWGFGAASSQLGPGYNFLAGLNSNLLTDATGVDLGSAKVHIAPIAEQANLFSSQWELGAAWQPTETNGVRSYVAGLRVPDKRQNWAEYRLTTSPGNLYNVNGALSTPGNVGLDHAAFGWNESVGDLDIEGLPRNITWKATSISSLSTPYTFTASNSVVGVPNGFLSARATYNGQASYGAGAAFDRFQVATSAGGATGGTANFDLKLALDQIATNRGLSNRQGDYRFEFRAADNAGQPLGDREQPRERSFWWDHTSPGNLSLTYNGTVTPGTNAEAIIAASDNMALRLLLIGIQFQFAQSLFNGGFAYVPLGTIKIPDAKKTPVLTTSMPISGIVPVGFWFFHPATGVVDFGTFYRSRAGMLQAMDRARNLSALAFVAFSNNAPLPAALFLTAAYATMATNSWCPGICSSGSNAIDVNFRYADSRPTGTPVISKAAWFALPLSGGGVVYPLGHTTTFTETPQGGGRLIDFPMTLDLLRYCGPTGPVLVFPIGYSADGLWLVKANPFFSVTVFVPNPFSNRCNEA